jgi:hypothetical protein
LAYAGAGAQRAAIPNDWLGAMLSGLSIEEH